MFIDERRCGVVQSTEKKRFSDVRSKTHWDKFWASFYWSRFFCFRCPINDEIEAIGWWLVILEHTCRWSHNFKRDHKLFIFLSRCDIWSQKMRCVRRFSTVVNMVESIKKVAVMNFCTLGLLVSLNKTRTKPNRNVITGNWNYFGKSVGISVCKQRNSILKSEEGRDWTT